MLSTNSRSRGVRCSFRLAHHRAPTCQLLLLLRCGVCSGFTHLTKSCQSWPSFSSRRPSARAAATTSPSCDELNISKSFCSLSVSMWRISSARHQQREQIVIRRIGDQDGLRGTAGVEADALALDMFDVLGQQPEPERG